MVRTLFAVPYDLRMLAESNIDQARVAYTQVMDEATQAMNIWLDALPRSEVTSRFKAVHQQAMGYAFPAPLSDRDRRVRGAPRQ